VVEPLQANAGHPLPSRKDDEIDAIVEPSIAVLGNDSGVYEFRL
jgi:hypothetical protein